MRKLIAIIAALGLFGVPSLSRADQDPVGAGARDGKKGKSAMAYQTKKPGAKIKKTKKKSSDAVIFE